MDPRYYSGQGYAYPQSSGQQYSYGSGSGGSGSGGSGQQQAQQYQYTTSDGPVWNWWIPAEGIHREVIQVDIQRYLGPGAVSKPGKGHGKDAVSST
jgi:hypothetical protein